MPVRTPAPHYWQQLRALYHLARRQKLALRSLATLSVVRSMQVMRAVLRLKDRENMTQPVIAMVDDDPAMLSMVGDVLTDEGYQVLLWSEGKEAYDLVGQHHPDLLILDLRMEHPQAGWIIIHMLRLDPRTAKLPVLVCTGDVDYVRTHKQILIENDCSVLLKPFSADELLTIVSQLLNKTTDQPIIAGPILNDHRYLKLITGLPSASKRAARVAIERVVSLARFRQ